MKDTDLQVTKTTGSAMTLLFDIEPDDMITQEKPEQQRITQGYMQSTLGQANK